ncbi:hypothetical protein HDU79_003928 [Rhizoclosmatium sp. JEL0117]|nr:hypothetical protein HDU79_003928 [Rhizoclosmatium sp. JEL0117]
MQQKRESSATLFSRASKVPVVQEIEQLWPHSIIQAEKVPLAQQRLNAWRHIVEELLQFVVVIQSIEKEYAREYDKFAARLAKLGTTPQNPVSFEESTGIPVETVQKSLSKLSDEHLNFERSINDTCYKLLLELKAEITRRSKDFKADTDSLTKTVTKSRTATINMISLHEKVKARRVSNTRANDNSFVDLWLTERVLYKHLREMIHTENKYQENMLQLLNGIQEFDEKVVTSVKYVLGDFFLAREHQHDTINALLQHARTHVNALESSAPFSTFATTTTIFDESAWKTSRSLQTFPYEIQEIQILKQSVMSRQYFWSRSGWTQALFVITESGYLHCFKRVHGRARGDEVRKRALDKKPVFGWGLGKKNVGLPVVPPSAEILEAEMHETPAYNDLDTPATYYSICLSNSGRIAVNVIPEKPCVFSIELFKSPRDPIAVKRYEIKANSESEMIEWVSFLKEKIESYLPQGPPEPLFLPEHEILDRVETAVRRPPPPVPVKKPVATQESEFTVIEDEINGVGEITGRTFTLSSTSKVVRKAPEPLLA